MVLRRLSLILLTLVCVAMARGQESQIRYWFDNDMTTAVTVPGTSLTGPIDVSKLHPGIHTLYAQAVGRLNSPVASRIFLCVQPREATPVFTSLMYSIDGAKLVRADVTAATDSTYVCVLDASSLKGGDHTLSCSLFANDGRRSTWQETSFFIESQTETPVITLDGYEMKISCGTEGAQIRYTLDGTEPTASSTLYSKAVNLTGDCVVKVIGIREGFRNSGIAEASFSKAAVTCAAPTITFNGPKMTLATTTSGAQIRYTLDGTTPTAQSALYAQPVELDRNIEVKAIAMRAKWFDSAVSSDAYDGFKVATPLISNSGYTITIACDTKDAAIYYSIGSEATGETLYSGPFAVSADCVITARAEKEGWKQSETASYTFAVSTVTCAQPVFEPNGNILSISTPTSGAQIHYTLDGTTPTAQSVLYEQPLELTQNVIVKAIAMKSGWFDSEVAEYAYDAYQTNMPVITLDGYVMSISCGTEGAEIRYTLDGTEPGTASTRYTGTVNLTDDCEIKAIGIREGFRNSEVAEASFSKAAATCVIPAITFDGPKMTLATPTSGAQIHYTLDGTTPTAQSVLYEQPLELTQNTIVKAVAMKSGWFDSEVAEYAFSEFFAPAPGIGYDGRYVNIVVESGYEARYTLDGSEPGEEAQLYSGPFDAGAIATVKAAAFRENYNPSAVVEYRTPAYFDGAVATVETADSLSVAFGWFGREEIVDLKVAGQLGGADYALLRGLPSLRVLDLEAVEADELGAGALAGVNAVCVWLPASMRSAGDGLFAGAKRLGGVVWPAEAEATSQALSGIGNPNLLLCLAEGAEAPEGFANVVVGDFAESITLVDSTPGSFFAPFAFRAGAIEYTHKYTLHTPLGGETAGWETLALPFDVDVATHEREGRIEPFAAGVGFDEARPYWLMKAGADGFVAASRINANTPYLVSMPNNGAYSDSFILSGRVTFSAEDAEVEATPWASAQVGAFRFVPTTVGVAKADTVSVLNREAYDGNVPGSVFVAGERDAQPFEAYLTADARMLSKPVAVGALAGAQDGLGELARDTKWRVYVRDNVLHIYTMRAQSVTVYNVAGQAVRQVDLAVGDNAVRGLGGGVYFVKGAKALILP